MSREPEQNDPDRRIDRFLNDLHRLDHPDPPAHLADKIVRGIFEEKKRGGVRSELFRLAAGILVTVAAYSAWTSFEWGLDVLPFKDATDQVVGIVEDSLSTDWIERLLRF